MTVRIRPATPSDARACGTICFQAFGAISSAHNFPTDFPTVDIAIGFIEMAAAHPDIYGVVAEKDGHVVGSNFLWQQSTIAGIGPITIDPDAQNAGVGRSLMDAVLARAAETSQAGVRLVQAGYHGRSLSLYTKLGFDVREPLANMQGPAIGKPIADHAVRPATAQDLEACNRVCHAVHGHDRSGEVCDAIGRGTASLVEHDSRITGYTTGIGFFGHAVAETNNGLKALISAAPSFAGPGMLVPMRNADLFRWCLAEGARVVQPMTLLARGFYREPQGAFLPSILF